MNDRRLRDDVLAEIDFEPSVDSTDVGVQVKDGLVTLTGHVPTYRQKLAAERAAWRVRGVRAVVQNIDVQLIGDPPDDAEIARRALDALHGDLSVPRALRLTVSEGWVTLEGDAKWQFQRRNAEKAIHDLPGVIGITNRIALTGHPPVEPEAVRSHIVGALARNAEVEASRIEVAVRDDGTVTLAGHVDSRGEHAAVEHAVWSTPGVRSVVDRLTIG